MDTRKFALYSLSTWICINTLFCTSSAELKKHYWEELCNGRSGRTLYLKNIDSGIIDLYRPGFAAGECTIRLMPPSGSSVVLSIFRYHLSSEEQLTITDSDYFQVALLGRGFYTDARKSFISNGEMVIHYSWNFTEPMESYFRLQSIFTRANDGPCSSNEFECRNMKCISKELLCDRFNHCGDNSDQENCRKNNIATKIVYEEKVTYGTPVWIIVLIVCSVILMIVIVVFIVMIIRSNRRIKKYLASKTASQTVASTQLTTVAASTPPNPSAPPEAEAAPSLFARFRQSLRGIKSSRPAEEPKSDNYQVPSM